jgi:hypothetical protein
MRRWRPPQPDLFMTPLPYNLQRTTVMKLLKMLLAEAISDAPRSERMHIQGTDNEQDHH